MKNAEPIIHVGILTNHAIEFVLNGDFRSTNGTVFTGKHKAIFRKGKIFFNGDSFEEIIFYPITKDASFDLIDVVIGINFHWERKENQRFNGALKFIVEGQNLTAINRINVEDYLISVISSEMSATASDELLKAHAYRSYCKMRRVSCVSIFQHCLHCSNQVQTLLGHSHCR